MIKNRLALVVLILSGLLLASPTLAKKGGKKQQTPPPEQQPADQDATTQPAPNAVSDAEAKLNQIVAKLQAAFYASDDYKTAVSNADESQSDYDAAKKNALAGLASNPDYQAALQDRANAQDAIDQAHKSDDSSPDQIAELAQQAMKSRSAVTKLESDAIASDPAASAAKTKFTAAGATLAAMRQKFQDSIKSDPEWQAAKKDLDDALAAVAAKPPPSGPTYSYGRSGSGY